MQLIATKRMRYRTRALAAGERFDAPDRDAWILVYATKKAKFAEDEPAPTPAPTPAPAPAPAPPPAPARTAIVADTERLERLRASARRLGIAVDNRWGVDRLESEIASPRSPRGPAV